MSEPLLTIGRGDSLNAWALSPVEATYFPGEPAPAHDPQHYKYINGFVDVGDLPCRIATWRQVATSAIALRTDWPVESLYLPGSNRRVEFSQFRHRPTVDISGIDLERTAKGSAGCENLKIFVEH